MFANPTVNDAIALLQWHLDKALKGARATVQRIKAEHAAAGRLKSGATIKRVMEETHHAFDGGVQATLGELKRIIRNTDLDAAKLRQITGDLLGEFATSMEATTEPDALKGFGGTEGVRKHIDEQLAEFDRRLQFALRQFDVGFLVTAEPEIPPMAGNNINIGTMTGSAIQLGSPGATQSVEFRLDIGSATSAVERFEAALAQQKLDNATMITIAADLATIKAQLSKPSPSITILHEAGKTIRNVVEGIAAGILTSDILPAAIALGAALGVR